MKIPALEDHAIAHSSVSTQLGAVTTSARLWSHCQLGLLVPTYANKPFASTGTTLHCCSCRAFGPEPAPTLSAGTSAGLAHAFPLPPCSTQLYPG